MAERETATTLRDPAVPDELYPADTFWARAVTLEEVAGPSHPLLAASSSGTQARRTSQLAPRAPRSVSLGNSCRANNSPARHNPQGQRRAGQED